MFGLQLGPCIEHYLDRDTKKRLNNSFSMPEFRAKRQSWARWPCLQYAPNPAYMRAGPGRERLCT
jgi:hypothetical protein